jgi:hypothetical protein
MPTSTGFDEQTAAALRASGFLVVAEGIQAKVFDEGEGAFAALSRFGYDTGEYSRQALLEVHRPGGASNYVLMLGERSIDTTYVFGPDTDAIATILEAELDEEEEEEEEEDEDEEEEDEDED